MKKRQYFFLCLILFGILETGYVAKADTVIDAKPEVTTEDTTQDPSTKENTSENESKDGGQDTTVSEGWNKSKTSYYVNGKKVKGAQNIDGKWYYFTASGTLYKKTGMRTLDGKTYYFNKNHTMKTGVIKVNKKNYYFQASNGERYEETGLHKVDKKYYFFDKDYKLKSGWYRDEKGKRHYFSKKTYAGLTGWNYVGKYKYYFNKKGELQQDVRKKIKKQSSYVIKVNRTACCVTVYAKDGIKGYTIPVVAFICSPGKDTPTGTFHTGIKHRWNELFGPCWGQWTTQITGNILFHSVYYDQYNDNKTLNVAAYNKLGTMASHGCVRLRAGDAKWIYDNCKTGTKVVIYNKKKDPGPFDKPTITKLSPSHTWDPTDPAFK